ncbi:MAG: hypothetical protein NC829_03200 [Candidatus Omnitrophica bacterium]|nr:hypothetical protein [Candidatus Omnitrophota bacterium]
MFDQRDAKDIKDLESKVSNIAVQVARIEVSIDVIRNDIEKIGEALAVHSKEHRTTDIEIENLKLRTKAAEAGISSFQKKMWTVIVAAISSVGTIAVAIFNHFFGKH